MPQHLPLSNEMKKLLLGSLFGGRFAIALFPSFLKSAVNWKDEYLISKERVAFTTHELQIPGIRFFATERLQNAKPPLAPHYHEDAFEFTLITKGTMSFYTGKKEYNVPGGSIFVSFPNEIHSTNDLPISLNHQYWIQVDISAPDNFLFLNRESVQELIHDLTAINRHVIATDNQEIRRIIEQAFRLCEADGNRLQISGYLLVFFRLLLFFSKEPKYHRSPDIEAAVTYIKEHITEELFLDEIAKVAQLSTSQFKQKFCHIVGVPSRSYEALF